MFETIDAQNLNDVVGGLYACERAVVAGAAIGAAGGTVIAGYPFGTVGGALAGGAYQLINDSNCKLRRQMRP